MNNIGNNTPDIVIIQLLNRLDVLLAKLIDVVTVQSINKYTSHQNR